MARIPKAVRAEAVRAYIVGLASKGGKARAQKLTPAQRRKISKDGARARWGKRSRQG